MNTPGKDYTHHSWLAAAALIAVLVAVSFIPPQSVGGVKLRRANILSDLLSFDDAEAAGTRRRAGALRRRGVPYRHGRRRRTHRGRHHPARGADHLRMAPAQDTARRERAVPDSARFVATLTPIEDFSDSRTHPGLLRHAAQRSAPGAHRLPGRLVRRGRHPHGRPARTAPVGLLGRRRGFAPMASPLTAFRRTVKTQSKGWTTYNIMQRKAAPAAPARALLRLGLGEPACGRGLDPLGEHRLPANASTPAPRRASSSSRPGDSRVEVTLNDALRREFEIAGDDAVRQIAVSAPHIRSLAFKVLLRAEGFIGYGAVFEGRRRRGRQLLRAQQQRAGDVLDQPVGQRPDQRPRWATTWWSSSTGSTSCSRACTTTPTTPDRSRRWSPTSSQCFPAAAVLVLGVSDRSVKTDAGFEPMDAIPHMLDCQRRCAAREHGRGLLRPTCDAMRAAGRHGTVRRQRLGRQGLHPHQLRRRAPRGMGARSTPSTPGSRKPTPSSGSRHASAARPRRPSSTRRAGAADRPQHPPGPILRNPSTRAAQ